MAEIVETEVSPSRYQVAVGLVWPPTCRMLLGTKVDHEVRQVGFELVPDWESVYFHPRLRLMLSVYVGDFKLAGQRSALVDGWKLLRQNLELDTPTPLGTYLGCGHKSINVATSEVLARTLLSKHVLRVEQVQRGPRERG